MVAMYPEPEPHATGMLDVGDGNRVYWESCGNRDGKPVVVLHGGPGAGCRRSTARAFDPDAYRIVLLDQRQCGRSTPHASDPATDLSVNTTEHLIGDIERLRDHLGIEQWLVYGGSWGSTLGLAYAQRHPGRVTEMLLVAITTTRRSEIDWLYHGLGSILPEQWHRFREGVPEAERDGDLVAAYRRLVESPDARVREQAARDWLAWEAAVLSVDPDAPPPAYFADHRWGMAFVRIVTHYFHHAAWLEEGVLLREAGRLAGIPGVLVHGSLDLQGPLVTAWELARAWPEAELVVVKGAGHSRHDGMGAAIKTAADRFAPGGTARIASAGADHR
ncbi:prolyl aminopeptidase [Pseudonocardia aurantiaca]|uniref:Proline iminopeptidase n=1 Tax=Pseudonocardia aurantiaca TaxID=75290 RepID=A0ABW4FF29_9PSEU